MRSKLRHLARQNAGNYHGRNNRHHNSHSPPRNNSNSNSNNSNNDASSKNNSSPNSNSKRARTDDGADQRAALSSTNVAATSSSGGGVIPSITLADLGGLSRELPVIDELVQLPIRMPHLFSRLGADPPCGVLLHGPPGVGKTKLVHAIAGTMQVPLFFVAAPEIVSGISGDSEAKLRSLFTDAIAAAPSIVFIDEIDTIAGRREEAQRGMEARIVGQLLTCMDQVAQAWRQEGKVVCVMGATNRPEAMDSALRRAGRFDREIALGIPSLDERQSILRVVADKVHTAADVDWFEVANMTPGFVGADLHLLVKEACVLAIQRVYAHMEQLGRVDTAPATAAVAEKSSEPFSLPAACTDTDVDLRLTTSTETLSITGELAGPRRHESGLPLTTTGGMTHTTAMGAGEWAETGKEACPLCVTLADLKAATTRVQPSAMREGFTTIPNVSWEDVGALEEVRAELVRSILQPIRAPKLHRRFGLDQPVGVLLYGPPGCGKTLVAKAISNQSGANFISIKGPELLNKFVGESERSVRMVFARGRASAPCVLFFDELDALAPRRGSDRANPSSERVVNQLLTELDGIEGRKDVYVMGATNRPDMIDPAMLRPGRLDKLLYVSLPSASQRESILRTHARRYPIGAGVDLQRLAQDARLEGFSGADLAALMREAALSALKRVYDSRSMYELEQLERDLTGEAAATASLPTMEWSDFESSMAHVQPSVSPADRASYEHLCHQITSAAKEGGG